ncbi:hypothetical protein Ahia01_001149600 [Argonauta hians]
MHVMALIGQQGAFTCNPSHREAGVEELRLAFVFGKLSIILLFMGIIITWLEWNIVFWESITGPFLMIMSFLLFIMSAKQFQISKKRKEESASCSVHENNETCMEDELNGTENIDYGNPSNWPSINLVELPSYEEALQSMYYSSPSRIESPYSISSPPSYEQVISMDSQHYDRIRIGAACSSEVAIQLPEAQSEKPLTDPT